MYQRHRRDCIARVVSMTFTSGIETDRYGNIAHVEQRSECEKELAKRRPLPLPPKLQDIVGEDAGSGKGWGRRMWGSRGGGESTSERATRHGTTPTLSF